VRPYTGKRTLDVVCSDPVIQLYLTKRIEKYGRIPYDANTRIRSAAYKFLRFCKVEPSNHAFSDIVAQRLAVSPQDRSLSLTERGLKCLRALQDVESFLRYDAATSPPYKPIMILTRAHFKRYDDGIMQWKPPKKRRKS
jgi:hypothetical protein